MDANAHAIVIALNRLAHRARERWSAPFEIAANQQHFDPLLLGRAASESIAKSKLGIAALLLDFVDAPLMLWATSLALWRRSRIAYRFDADVWEELIATPVESTPVAAFRMPHEAALIIPPTTLTLPRADGSAVGVRAILTTVGEFRPHEVKIVIVDDYVVRTLGDVIVHPPTQRGRMPREEFEFPAPYGLYLSLTGDTIGDALRASFQNTMRWMHMLATPATHPHEHEHEHELERQMRLITTMAVNALLLISSPGCDITDDPSPCPPSPRQPQDRHQRRTPTNAPHPSANDAVLRTVGAVWGAALRIARERESRESAPHVGEGDAGRASPRPHLRRGHWRWQACGPRHSDRQLRWIHPCLVGAERANHDVPAVIRPVKR